MHQSTIGKPDIFCFSCESYDQYKGPRKYKNGHNFRKKRKKNGRLSVCVHMRFKYDVKFSDRTSQNWRSIAVFGVRLFGRILTGGRTVGLCVGLCLRASLMYDVYDCIESTEMVE